ncbi:hypothetical protein MASR2M29_00920 [Spirochaetota bacterium]
MNFPITSPGFLRLFISVSAVFLSYTTLTLYLDWERLNMDAYKAIWGSSVKSSVTTGPKREHDANMAKKREASAILRNTRMKED